ncbi:MAG: phosphodiester glycosidase family protein [Terrimicrobiaceae bacterium]|nr:phosphodiester glycosidase family protein [Terrimicrobiaceae bacterium]
MKVVATLLALAVLPATAWDVQSREVLAAPARSLEICETRLGNPDRPVTVTSIVFGERAFTLRVVDSPSPGESRLAPTLEEVGAVAGVNGGYFHSDQRPVGLMIVDGREIHPFQRAKLLSGVLEVRAGKIAIVRSSRFSPARDVREAIQCGPMLVDGGEAVAGLNAVTSARRTVVATDGRGRWALAYLTSVTLADAAGILLTPGVFGDWTPRTALNLDGGGSSGLWAAGPPVVSRPEFSRVRNFIGVVPRR